MALKGRRILLGVSGGIAVYKAVELLRMLQREGAEVRVVMTESATKFVSPLTFSTLSRYPAYYSLFSDPQRWEIEHISLAEFAELFLIAPATANIIGKLASGIGDDLLTTTALSVNCPKVIAPAMHSQMWSNPIVQENIKKLKWSGYYIVEPEEGELASGGRGKGRLASLEKIVEVVKEVLNPNLPLRGVKILITAGPTREYIDPIRFISNPSSGIMGYTLAEEAIKRGAEVILISGPTNLAPPPGCVFVSVETTDEMLSSALEHFKDVDVIIATAAVSDFKPLTRAEQKIKKKGELVLRLTTTPDVLLELGKRKGNKILVGFAAETDNLIENALEKMEQKNLDIIVANLISPNEYGFGEKDLFASIIRKDKNPPEPTTFSKRELAIRLLEEIESLIKAK
ncbi:bifunctional phosphopantothenoylcysteine decarboxylase/phosphopantothenate--cysteine ligase CoaBC [bacterium]|nr:bifunctional phosphopantothenoylcysteine decarboxylase/phosphopantothenate--cysteine ligase CoaBC [bacterium]